MRDYWGATVADLQVPLVAAQAQFTLTLPAGFYEVSFPDLGQTFGLVASATFSGATDPFFGIDSALSWLELRPEVRTRLVRDLARNGIGTARERVSWGEINPAENSFTWTTAKNYDALRQLYAAQGITVLDCFHSAPTWTGRTTDDPYPARLGATQAAWQQIGQHWAAGWNALEVWNEPDIDFGKNLPADQYVPVAKALDYTFTGGGLDVPLGGGVFSTFNPAFINEAGRNGLFDVVDFVSFHDYAKALALAGVIRDYRNALATQGNETLPLWITECGWNWTAGPARPPLAEDTQSALEITMKAVEARACGVARYFPFVYSYYEEDGKNFGMLGRETTPLRSLAAYLQAVQTLSHATYAGDLAVNDATVKRARVFHLHDGTHSVAVLYTGAPKTTATVHGNLPPALRCTGLDGRAFALPADGAVPIPDGLTYVYFDRAVVSAFLVTDATTAQLATLGQQAPPSRPAASPLILEYRYDSAHVTPSKLGYTLVNQAEAASFPLTLRVHNLSTVSRAVTLQSSISGNPGSVQSVTVPALGTTDVVWNLNLDSVFASAPGARVEFTGDAASGVLPVSLDFRVDRPLAEWLAFYPASLRQNLADSTRWQSSLSPGGQMSLTFGASSSLLAFHFPAAGDNWAYPRLVLGTADFSRATGVLLRVRISAGSTLKLQLLERDGSKYVTPFALCPADGQWYTRLVRFDDFTAATSQFPDENRRLDPAQIDRLAVGLNSGLAAESVEISDLYIVTE